MMYSLVPIDPIPAGLTINETTGVIDWNPTNKDVTDGATYDFTIPRSIGRPTKSPNSPLIWLWITSFPLSSTGSTDIYMTESSGVQSFNFQTDDEADPGSLRGYKLLSYGPNGDDTDPAVPAWLQLDPGNGNDGQITGKLLGTPGNDDVTASGTPMKLRVEFDDSHSGGKRVEVFYVPRPKPA